MTVRIAALTTIKTIPITTALVVLCPTANAENIRTFILPLDLDDSFRVSCD